MGNQPKDLTTRDNDASEAVRAGPDDVVIPGSPPPLGSERTDVSPGDEAGVDELPGNNGTPPQDNPDEREVMKGVPDVDPDSAELDDAPNPR